MTPRSISSCSIIFLISFVPASTTVKIRWGNACLKATIMLGSGEPFHVSTTVLGFLFVTYLSGTFSSTLAGKLLQRMKQSVCMAIGIAIMVLGIMLTMITHVFFVILGLLFLCFGFFFAHSCSSAWVSQQAKFAKASASGLYLTTYYLVGSIGTVYLGYFWSYYGWSGVVVGCLFVRITIY